MKRELFVGGVFAVILAMLLGTTLWIEDPGFFERSGGTPMTVRFREVAGLTPGAEVWVYGTPGGRVKAIRPDGKGGVLVDMELDADPQMRTDGTVEIRTRSALGGAVVAIQPGAADVRADGAEPIEGRSAADAFGEVAALARDIRGPLKETIENARKITGDLSERSATIVDNLDAFAKNARTISDDLVAGKGTAGKLLNDSKLHDDLAAAVESLRKIADAADGGGGVLDVLLHDRAVADDLKKTVENVRSVTAKLDSGEGTLGRLLNDATLHDDLTAAVADLRKMTGDASSGKGVLGKLIYDEALAARLDTISDDVAQITGKIRRGEGTLGKLVNDEQLYADLKSTLKSLRAGSDDVRENAPILTFAGFLFSGF